MARLRITAALAILLALAACVSQTDMAALESAAATFHRRQQAGEDAANYRDAAQAFRAAVTEADFLRIEAAVRAAPECGQPVRDPNNYRSNASTSGNFVTVVYNRTCANGPLSEQMTFQMSRGEAQLAGYYISGMALFPAGQTAPAPAPAPAPPGQPA